MSLGDIFFWHVDSTLDILGILIKLIVLAFLVWMVIDCYNRKFKVEAEKWIWIVLMIFTWVASIIYYVVIRTFNERGIAKK